MKLLVLTWTRTGELRAAEWPEIDFNKREWKIPAEHELGAYGVPLVTSPNERQSWFCTARAISASSLTTGE